MKIEFFEETNFSYRRKQDLEKDLNLHWIARNMAGDKVGDIPAILQVLQHPLTTESEIEKRQQVVTAACENSSVTYQLRDRYCFAFGKSDPWTACDFRQPRETFDGTDDDWCACRNNSGIGAGTF